MKVEQKPARVDGVCGDPSGPAITAVAAAQRLATVMIEALSDRAYPGGNEVVVPKRFEPYCRVVLETLISRAPGLKAMRVEYVDYPKGPPGSMLIRARWEG